MSTLGNIIWLIFGGPIAGFCWLLCGVLMVLTIIGIPYARSCFVIAKFSFLPFGRELIKRDELSGQGDLGTGIFGMIANVIWIVFFGWSLALVHLLAAGFNAITIVGIPFALQHLKLAAVCFAPVGKTVVKRHLAEAAWMHNAQAQLQQIRSKSPTYYEPQQNLRRIAHGEASVQSSLEASPQRLLPVPMFTVARGEQTFGEFTASDIRQHLSTGLLVETDWFWNQEAYEWQAIGRLSNAQSLPPRLLLEAPSEVGRCGACGMVRAHRSGCPNGHENQEDQTARNQPDDYLPASPKLFKRLSSKVCRDCGHEVSPFAPTCPNCDRKLKMGLDGMLATGVAIIAVVGVVVVLCGMSLLWSILPQTGHVVRSSKVTPTQATSSAPTVPPTPRVAEAKAQPEEIMSPHALATAAPAPETPPGLDTHARDLQASSLPQVDPSTDPNFPTQVTIKRRTSTTEPDAPGDVEVIYRGGTWRWLTDGETSSQAKFSPQNGTIGWVVNEAPSHRPGDGYVMSYEVRPRHKLVLFRAGKIVGTLQSKLIIIENWSFEDNGTKVALCCRQSHGPALFEVFDVESGSLLATAAEDNLPQPSWTAAALPTPSALSSPGAFPPGSLQPPRSVVECFYSWYFYQVRHGQSPWLAGELSKRPEISHGFAVRLENAKEPEPGNDPIFASAEVPVRQEVTDARVNGFDATVAVRLAYTDTSRFVNVRVIRANEGEPWQIDDVQPVLAANPAPTPENAFAEHAATLRRIAVAEARLNDTYAQLRGRLNERQRAVLKQEEVAWIKRKDAVPAGTVQRADIIDQRTSELLHWEEPPANAINAQLLQYLPPKTREQAALKLTESFMDAGVKSALPPLAETPLTKNLTRTQLRQKIMANMRHDPRAYIEDVMTIKGLIEICGKPSYTVAMAGGDYFAKLNPQMPKGPGESWYWNCLDGRFKVNVDVQRGYVVSLAPDLLPGQLY
jgi:uncharacterized membrane protein YccF (DUF307 family)